MKLILKHAEFYRFKGFDNSNIKHLKADFKEVLQIINSTNGTGKSTFISELNPRTINKELFYPDGYKRLIYEFTNRDGETTEYEFYSSPKTHQFIDRRNDTNLNSGNTITQYNDLLLTHLGVTPYTWDIAMGAISFTDLDKNERRKWIETISGVDFSFAFSIFDKLVKRITGVKHSLKLISNDLVAEKERVIPSDTLNAFKVTKGTLIELTGDLMRLSDSNVDVSYESKIIAHLDKLKAKAQEQSERLEKGWYRNDAPAGIRSPEMLTQRITAYQSKLSIEEERLDNLRQTLGEKEALLERVQDIDGLSLDEVIVEQKEINIKLDKINAKLNDLGAKDYKQFIGSRDAVEDIITHKDVLAGFSQWWGVEHSLDAGSCCYTISKEAFNSKQDHLQDLQRNITICNTRLKELEEHVEDLKNGKEVTCPQCQHHFIDGLDKVSSLRVKYKEIVDEKKRYKATLDNVLPEVEQYLETTKTIEFVVGYFKSVWGNKPSRLGYHFIERVSHGESLQTISHTIAKLITLADVMVVYFDLVEDKKRWDEVKRKFDAVGAATNKDVLADEVEALRKSVIDKQDSIASLNKTIAGLQKYNRSIESQLKLADEHIATLEEIAKFKKKYIKVINESLINTTLKELESKLVTTTSKINNNDNTLLLISNLQKMLDKQKKELAILNDLHKAIGPNGGVIAEQLTGYCTTFAQRLTEVLEMVWGYEMVVKPCVNKKGIIDYKFPLKFSKGTVADIAKGSKAMRAIINLAVMICTRSALKLNHLPMFFDEVGEGLDVEHTTRLRTLIRTLIRSEQCSMVFFVDHDVNNRSMLGDYEEIVFDASQVITSETYNEHVSITHY